MLVSPQQQQKKQKMKSAAQMHDVEVQLLTAMTWGLQSDGLWSRWSEGWRSSAPMREEDALSSSHFRVRRTEIAHLSQTHTGLQPRHHQSFGSFCVKWKRTIKPSTVQLHAALFRRCIFNYEWKWKVCMWAQCSWRCGGGCWIPLSWNNRWL